MLLEFGSISWVVSLMCNFCFVVVVEAVQLRDWEVLEGLYGAFEQSVLHNIYIFCD